MPEIKLNLRPNLLRLLRYLSAIILNYVNQFRKRSIIDYKMKLNFRNFVKNSIAGGTFIMTNC
ncbi:replicative DNA helicase [Orientia tsutsugamushi]|uniref:Replicative DNA helicase n=1 Tax=Orientia tsutsugamushi TaxID=784 RepID=A0A2U3QTB7_ORITS|nr:replicative DNA helicase [Orientia tsutsugamushi]